jgi:hypothetical protein
MISARITESEIAFFLLKTFAYIDVIGALSSSSASSVLITNEEISNLWTIHDYKISRKRHDCLLDGQATSDLDFLLGVDLNMIPVFSKVSSLVRRRKLLDLKQGPILSLDKILAEEDDLRSEALELSRVLLSCCSSISSPPSTGDIEQEWYGQLRVMNATFCYAALIHLYRRALQIPSESVIVQSIVNEITNLLETKIPHGTRQRPV